MTAVVRLLAEIGSVHDGSFGNACKAVEAAAAAGAHAVKFQTHLAQAETLESAPSPSYFSSEPRFEYFRRTAFTSDQWHTLKEHCDRHGVEFLSSPFSLEAVDLLEDVGVGAYKIPSGEVTNLPLLERVAATGKPVLLSSGMSDWAELDAAVEQLGAGGPLTVLQCSSIYPCPPTAVGLEVMSQMQDRYGVPVGFSDHTTGMAASLAAAALGASVIEKHFTFSRLMYGSDAANGMEPGPFRELAQALEEIAQMLASPVDKDDLSPYVDMKRIFEKSIVLIADVPAGSMLERHHLGLKKPGDGIPAARLAGVIGRRAARDLARDSQLLEDDFS